MHDNSEVMRVMYNLSTGSMLTRPLEYMQYTGLLDKNGREIYEGDVIKYSQHWEVYPILDRIEKVVFEGGGFTPMCLSMGGTYYSCNSEEYEVLGNIYENPELIKS